MLSTKKIRYNLIAYLMFIFIIFQPSVLKAQDGTDNSCLKQIEHAIYPSLYGIPTDSNNIYPSAVEYEITYSLSAVDENSDIRVILKSFKNINGDLVERYTFYDKLVTIVNEPEVRKCLLSLELPSIRLTFWNTNTSLEKEKWSRTLGFKPDEHVIDIASVCIYRTY